MENGQFEHLLRRIRFEDAEIDSLPLSELVAGIPPLTGDMVGSGGHVLLRLDVDVPTVDGKVTDPTRLETGAETIKFCMSKGSKLVIFGHIGRDSSESLRPVAESLSQLLRTDVQFLPDWFDESALDVTCQAKSAIAAMTPGSVVLLENCRKYSLERDLWKITEGELSLVSHKLGVAAAAIRSIAHVEINESIAASNADFSSSVVPLEMDSVALGFFIRNELAQHAVQALDSHLVVISGLKVNKLDDLESIVRRKPLRTLVSAGSLAMALRKAVAFERGEQFSIGRAESDDSNKAYIPPKRIDQARRILEVCRASETEVILPVDFVLDDGSVSELIPDSRVQLDIGPKTVELLRSVFQQYAKDSANSASPFAMFTNGVFGKFEDPRYELGTKMYIEILQSISQDVRIYVGGGEGRLALERFGNISDVQHAFTAGGTILKCMGGKHVAYLKSLWLHKSLSG